MGRVKDLSHSGVYCRETSMRFSLVDLDEGALIPYASASSASPSAWAAKPIKPVSPSVALDAAARRPH